MKGKNVIYVRCINNRGYEASLTVDAVYRVLPDETDSASLRVIDNDGEDYLYDARRFVPVELYGHDELDDTLTA
jgi:hypothetical protein